MVTYVGYSTIDRTDINTVLTDKDLAVRDLMNHFYTRKGERVMNPNFGSILPDLVFEPLDDITEQAARDDVQNIIDSDPRWIFSEVNLSKPTDHQLDIRVRVVYDDTGLAEEEFIDEDGNIRKTLGVISNEDNEYHDIEYPIKVDREDIPKFKIEEFTKKLNVRIIDETNRLVEFYISKLDLKSQACDQKEKLI